MNDLYIYNKRRGKSIKKVDKKNGEERGEEHMSFAVPWCLRVRCMGIIYYSRHPKIRMAGALALHTQERQYPAVDTLR